MSMMADQPLRILHAVRTPVGGIFRHILDLANGQVDRGHQVGIIADSLTGGERAEAALAAIAPRLALGVHRVAIRREPFPTDVVYVGEFRHIKGADLLIDAVARLRADGRSVTLTLAGDGEEIGSLKAQVEMHGLGGAVRFIGHVKARFGFCRGSLLVVPSRGDSMPYVVIEAAAAGIPMVAANVGGIPEIFASHADALFAPNNIGAMADAIKLALEDPATALTRAKSLRERVLVHFSQKAMVEGVLAGYRDAFADR